MRKGRMSNTGTFAIWQWVVLERFVVPRHNQSVEGEDTRLRTEVMRRGPRGHHGSGIGGFIPQQQGVPANEDGPVSGLYNERDVMRTVSRGVQDPDAGWQRRLFQP